jgi:hypothetical protein
MRQRRQLLLCHPQRVFDLPGIVQLCHHLTGVTQV